MGKYSNTIQDRHLGAFLDSTSITESNNMPLIPKPLHSALNVLGLQLAEEGYSSEDKPWFRKIFSILGLKIFSPHFFLFIFIMKEIICLEHLTFVIGAATDMLTYTVACDLFLFRKNQILYCIKNLATITSDATKSLENRKFNKIHAFLAVAIIYACTYFTYGLIAQFKFLYGVSVATTSEIICNVLLAMHWISYCFYVYFGIPVQTVLFVYVSSLVHNNLTNIYDGLVIIPNANRLNTEAIRQAKLAFCKLQKYSSRADSIFNEVIFLWLMKILLRVCLSAIDVLTRSWTWTQTESRTQVIVLFDLLFDISHLLIVCSFGGQIVIAKKKILDCLISLNGNNFPETVHVNNEIHHFITILGHSDVEFTALNIFAIDRKTALTILGALGSYCVLIYQLAPN